MAVVVSVMAVLVVRAALGDHLSFGEDDTDLRNISRALRSANSCNCGWVNRVRVVGGRDTGRNEYPMMVGIQKKSSGFQFCGAAVITEWHVLTAAHCTEGYKAEDLQLALAAHELKPKDGSGRTVVGVAQIVDHQEYTSKPCTRDISLLVTDSKISFSKIIGPACLPRKKMYRVGEMVKLLGWGRTSEEGGPPAVLQEVDLRIISSRECKAAWRNVQEDSMLCTAGGPKDSCRGDSGGPLLWQDQRTKRYVLLAVVSYGGKCAGGKPAVNTDLAAYLPWITEKVKATKPGTQLCSSI